MTFGEKLKKYRDDRKITQEQLAILLDTTKQVISRYERSQRSPKLSMAISIAEKLNLPASYLVDDKKDSVANSINYIQPTGFIPILGIIPAGTPILAQENIESYMPVLLKNPHEYFGLRVKGDSMKNSGIKSGSIVIIHKQNYAENGDIVACRINGDEATLKRFSQSEDMVILSPENPDFQPLALSVKQFEDGYAEIIGIAKQIVTEI